MLANHWDSCKKVGIANGLKMLNLAAMEELVERVQRNQVEQRPSSDPHWKDDAVEVEVESADVSEGIATASRALHCFISRTFIARAKNKR